MKEPVTDRPRRRRRLLAGALSAPFIFTAGVASADLAPPRPVQPKKVKPGVVKELPNGDRIYRRSNGKCYLHVKTTCPEGAKCNPPPPKPVPCPKKDDAGEKRKNPPPPKKAPAKK